MSLAPADIRFDRFREADTEPFLALAAQEDWICDRWEFDFLLRSFPGGCLVARAGTAPVAFVTAIGYGTSGWIGNLLVRTDVRGRGIGGGLMERALAALAAAGAETVWLTASEAGRPIYERLGFATVDTIWRWVGTGCAGECHRPLTPSLAALESVDAAGWGEARGELLRATAGRGEVVGDERGFLVSQPCGGGVQLGPWGCADGAPTTQLLAEARKRAGRDVRVFLDSPARNTAAAALLAAHAFGVTGTNLLMRRGPDPGYRPDRVFALGSMGSMG